ncbi:NUBPL iron-transfer P-loop NTPase [Anaerosphaera aminiphila DSM 21120]|uniref:Iron-sulfur cluster carrier protein n=1 Tax=Anaerosphaera aminiphila DSM 21120 TaxID=1120995 RepID=A0A1M5PSN8_9FIRM|nr:P-loop NTPase [Anaerosphaera aminiphila]SHH04778.1 NUBPL iron-transfer P-loop NTPase [Anaerosphaera aminiphila DSM 21120]
MGVYGVISGKGGVGKSLVTSLLAVESNRRGLTTAILDGDLTGPSIPKAFNLKDNLLGVDGLIEPAETKTGIQVVSINLMLDDPSQPVLWKGPLLGGAIDQFWKETNWKHVDMTFIDMPPGTGDIAMKVMTDIPLDGLILVTTPQDLVQMIMKKAANMAKKLNIPIIGLVENMSYYICPNCNTKHEIFGPSQVKEVAEEIGALSHVSLGMSEEIRKLVDSGNIEEIKETGLSSIVDKLIAKE